MQHREVQGHESEQFKTLFKAIEYLGALAHSVASFGYQLTFFSPLGTGIADGGVESGFRKVEKDKYERRLLHCKGTRHVQVKQVELSSSSLNDGMSGFAPSSPVCLHCT